MSATGLFSVGGLMSGMDTNGIVKQLMQLERIPLTKIQSRQAALRKTDDAWGEVNKRLSALRTALDNVRKTSSFDGFTKVASSNADVAAVSKSGTPATGAATFTVDQLASAHEIAFNGTFGSADDLVGAGELHLQQGGVDYRITTTASTTVADLSRELNRAVPGASSQVVKVSEGVYRLVVTSRETGTAKALTVVGNPPSLGGISTLRAALDAKVTLGTGASAIQVTRSSNKITDLFSGVTVDLKQTSATPVTLTTSRDVDAAVTAVKGFVDSAAGMLSHLKNAMSYDPATKKAGVLQGNATARNMVLELRNALSGSISGLTGTYTTPGSVGIAIDRDGGVSLDEAKLREALAADFGAVQKLFSKVSSSTDSRVRAVTVPENLATGSYAVNVTTAATRGTVTGTNFTPPPPPSPREFTITVGALSAAVVLDDTINSVEDAVDAINTKLSEAGITTLTASVSGSAITLTGDYGSAAGFTVTDDIGNGTYGLEGSYAGTDAVATINGAAATAAGRRLTGTGAAEGLVVDLTGDGTGAVGAIEVTNGLGGRVHSLLKGFEGVEGSVKQARNLLTSQITYLDKRIEAFEVQLASREKTLAKKYAGLETALSRLQGGVSGLLSQLGNVNNR